MGLYSKNVKIVSPLVSSHEDSAGEVKGHGDDGLIVSREVGDHGFYAGIVQFLFLPSSLQVDDGHDPGLRRLDPHLVGSRGRHRVPGQTRRDRFAQTSQALAQGLGCVQNRRRVTLSYLAFAATAASSRWYQFLLAVVVAEC